MQRVIDSISIFDISKYMIDGFVLRCVRMQNNGIFRSALNSTGMIWLQFDRCV